MTIDYAVNIMSTYKRATPSELLDGIGWYARARDLALELTPDNVWIGAGVLSALSPFKRWDINVRIARVSISTGIAQGNMPMHNAIAQKVIDGVPTLDAINGPKTRSFAIAIATGGNGAIATIDRHAYDIAMAKIHTDKERKINKTVYREMAAAYQECGDYLGIAVNDIQAITWVTWKREKGVK